jgi:hypothetical protein
MHGAQMGLQRSRQRDREALIQRASKDTSANQLQTWIGLVSGFRNLVKNSATTAACATAAAAATARASIAATAVTTDAAAGTYGTHSIVCDVAAAAGLAP